MDNEIFVLSAIVLISFVRFLVGLFKFCKDYKKHDGLLMFEGVNG